MQDDVWQSKTGKNSVARPKTQDSRRKERCELCGTGGGSIINSYCYGVSVLWGVGNGGKQVVPVPRVPVVGDAL